MTLRETLKKIWQIELRTERLASASARCVELRIPTGFRPKAQGCEARATLGPRPARLTNRNAVAARLSTGGAPTSSPRHEPWDQALRISPAPSGAADLPSRRSFAPGGADTIDPINHGSRRGLPALAAPQLPESGSRVFQPRSVSVSRNSKPLEFEGFGNCGEFATIKRLAGEPALVPIPSNSTELKTPANAIGQRRP